MLNADPSKWKVPVLALLTITLMLLLTLFTILPPAGAQDAAGPDQGRPDAAGTGEPDSAESGLEEAGRSSGEPAAAETGPRRPRSERSGLPLFSLLIQPGWFFMVPIVAVSIGVVTLTIERFITLRRGRILPDVLVSELGKLGGTKGGFDPRQAYRLCQRFPSAASTVIRAMLLKVGRPHSEVEHAVREASDREANRLYANVRWLSLAAAVAPLWGLLGTVWGMMMAFYDTTQLAQGQNKAEALAEGIYTALVTTLCGLFIAIPSAIMSHYFEGRITARFHEIDELLFNLLPQIERYEGRVRFNRRTSGEETEDNGPTEASFVVGEPAAASTPK